MLLPSLLLPFIQSVVHPLQDRADVRVVIYVDLLCPVTRLTHNFFHVRDCGLLVANHIVKELGLLVADAEAHLVARIKIMRTRRRRLVCFDGLLLHLCHVLLTNQLRRVMTNVPNHEKEEGTLLILLRDGQTILVYQVDDTLLLLIQFGLYFALVKLQGIEGRRFVLVLDQILIDQLDGLPLDSCDQAEVTG